MSRRLRHLQPMALAFACAALFPLLVSAAQPQLIASDGTRVPAVFQSVNGEGRLVFRIGNQARQLSPDDVVAWGALPAGSNNTVLLLADGGQLQANLLSADAQSLQVESDIFGHITIPRSQVRGLLLNAPADHEARDQLTARALAIQGPGEWLLLDNGDELRGRVDSIDTESIQLHSQVGPTPIDLGRVTALVLTPSADGAQDQRSRMLAGFTDGSWLTVTTLTTSGTNSPRIAFDAATGWQATCPLQDLSFLQPLDGKASFLSDRTPVSYRHIPFLDVQWPYTLDRSVAGGLLRFDDQVFPKGIGMHSTARLTFDLSPEDRRFEADVSLDASAGQRGSVAFRVFVDNEQRFASPIVRGGDPPTPISVDVAGGQRLSLIVDFAERGDELDRANWLNARLMP